MSEINVYVGAQIRKYRKACKLTMQELADAIHKSRATVCKYENGTISIDIETLYEISQVLQVSFSQLSSYLPTAEEKDTIEAPFGRKSPFFQAKRLYFYFYDICSLLQSIRSQNPDPVNRKWSGLSVRREASCLAGSRPL